MTIFLSIFIPHLRTNLIHWASPNL